MCYSRRGRTEAIGLVVAEPPCTDHSLQNRVSGLAYSRAPALSHKTDDTWRPHRGCRSGFISIWPDVWLPSSRGAHEGGGPPSPGPNTDPFPRVQIGVLIIRYSFCKIDSDSKGECCTRQDFEGSVGGSSRLMTCRGIRSLHSQQGVLSGCPMTVSIRYRLVRIPDRRRMDELL